MRDDVTHEELVKDYKATINKLIDELNAALRRITELEKAHNEVADTLNAMRGL